MAIRAVQATMSSLIEAVFNACNGCDGSLIIPGLDRKRGYGNRGERSRWRIYLLFRNAMSSGRSDGNAGFLVNPGLGSKAWKGW